MSSSDDTAGSSPVADALAGLTLRSIGPALMGGRIADIAVHPYRPSTWFVAVGSGGVWRTTNAGITWEPVFDGQRSYSIGCVRIDPQRPNVVWVGTGEAVSGRHVAWGDGVYRSDDGGTTWNHVGLAHSEHISDILIDPRSSDTVFVAAEGPLWSSGGERGLFRTTDGGLSWEPVLIVDADTGVTSAVFAPDDPDTIYAATYQRRRRAWSFLAGGPGSGIHRSTDGGTTWQRVSAGLPTSDMGRIGLAVTAAAPDVVYATIEAADRTQQGFHRSTDRGLNWERRNEYVSSGTGPHYYQELFASPTDPERVYQVDVFLHLTTDGGATFSNMEDGTHKHSDNHVVWIDPADGQHLLVGTDAGLYETWDHGRSWRHTSNLPVSQFYRVAVDDTVPFANVLGGAQDLGTLHGPTRTTHVDGVRNQDWWVPLGADGYRVAFDPDDADISYVSWQVGNIMRHNRRTMELTDIQPQPGLDDPPERWNWDTPIHISPHRPGRIHVASQRVWRSDDRGNSWTPISPDLTTNANRYELAPADRLLSVDALWDHEAMSLYATITDLNESPVVEGLLYTGTDDGRVHRTDDGGRSWAAVTRPPELPERAFVNAVVASLHEPDGVFLAADDHKSGDYRPYLYESIDRGRTWRSITGDLPEDVIVWSIAQDHLDPDLLFLGAEDGLRVSLDRGRHWHRLDGGVPPIAFRDLALQRRDDDLVGASFGRGLFVLDDYGILRELGDEALREPAALFGVRDAWWYVPYRPMQADGQPTLGTTAFRAPNPPFGAVFTYHLADDERTDAEQRQADERAPDDADDIAFPGWDRLWAEHLQSESVLLLVVRDEAGIAVRSIEAARTKGLHRTAWDLRHAPPDPVRLDDPGFQPPWVSDPRGDLVEPGRYTVELVRATERGVELLAGPRPFMVRPTPAVAEALAGHDDELGVDTGEFRRTAAAVSRRVKGAAARVDTARHRIRHLRAALPATPGGAELRPRLDEAHQRLETLDRELRGDPVRRRLSEAAVPSVAELVGRAVDLHGATTGPPTATQRAAVERAAAALAPIVEELTTLVEVDLAALAAEIDALGGPWTPR